MGYRSYWCLVVFVLMGCSSVKTEPTQDSQKNVVGAETVTLPPDDDVDRLSQEIYKLNMQLVAYTEPLTPQQQKEILRLKEEIHKKETQKASLELKQMLQNLPEVDEGEAEP